MWCGNGTGCKVNIISVDGALGAITSLTIAEEGSGYSVGDTLIINGGDNNATFKVGSVGGVSEVFYGAFDYSGRVGLISDTSTDSFNNNDTSGWDYYFKMTNPNGGAKSRWQSDTELVVHPRMVLEIMLDLVMIQVVILLFLIDLYLLMVV